MAMPEVAADLVERQPSLQQVRRTGMAESMRAVVRQRHTQRVQAATGQSCQATASQGSDGRSERQEDLAMTGARPYLLQVTQHGIADGLAEGIGPNLLGLGASNQELLPLPVEIVQTEAHDLP